MTRRLTITSWEFEGLVQRLPANLDVVLTANETHKFLELDDVTYIAPLDSEEAGR